MTYKQIWLISLGLLFHGWLIAQEGFIDVGCDEVMSNSNVEMETVQIFGFNANGTSLADRRTIEVSAGEDCFNPDFGAVEISAGAAFTIRSRENAPFAYHVLVDWNNDGQYDLNNEVFASGTSTTGFVTDSFLLPPNDSDEPRDYLSTMRIMIAETPAGLQDADTANSLEISIQADDKKVTISKTGNAPNVFDFGNSCYEFTDYDEIKFSMFATLNGLQYKITKVVIEDVNTRQAYTVYPTASDDELYLVDKKTNGTSTCSSCNTQYNGQQESIGFNDEHIFALRWNAIRALHPDLNDLLTQSKEYRVDIFYNQIDGVDTESLEESFYLGCCQDSKTYQATTTVNDEASYIPLYTSSGTVIEIVPNNLIEVYANQHISLKAQDGIRFTDGFRAAKGSSVHAYTQDCGYVPRLPSGSGTALSIGDEEEAEEDTEEILTYTPQLSAKPNPFNNATTLEYSVRSSMQVTITLYDLHGRPIQQLLSEKQEAGRYQIDVAGTDLVSGIYLCVLKMGHHTKTLRIIKS